MGKNKEQVIVIVKSPHNQDNPPKSWGNNSKNQDKKDKKKAKYVKKVMQWASFGFVLALIAFCFNMYEAFVVLNSGSARTRVIIYAIVALILSACVMASGYYGAKKGKKCLVLIFGIITIIMFCFLAYGVYVRAVLMLWGWGNWVDVLVLILYILIALIYLIMGYYGIRLFRRM